MAVKKKADMNTSFENVPKTLEKHSFYGLQLDEQQKEFRDAIWDPKNLIVFASAKSGTGKTLIAVATANLLVKYGLYDGIVYVVSPVQEEKSGYLPGSADQKTFPYAAPLYDALVKLDINPFTALNQESVMNQKNGIGYIDCMSHLWLRGCNLNKKVVIIDESQNFYKDELKKVLTRISDTSKTIVIGHTGQCDLYHYPERSGFAPYIEHFTCKSFAKVCELSTNHRGLVSSWADEL